MEMVGSLISSTSISLIDNLCSLLFTSSDRLLHPSSLPVFVQLARCLQRPSVFVTMSVDIEKSSGDSSTIAVSKFPDAIAVESIAWNDPREKRNPKNWSMPKRVFHTALPSILAFEMSV